MSSCELLGPGYLRVATASGRPWCNLAQLTRKSGKRWNAKVLIDEENGLPQSWEEERLSPQVRLGLGSRPPTSCRPELALTDPGHQPRTSQGPRGTTSSVLRRGMVCTGWPWLVT
jgi:hypothetical protein